MAHFTRILILIGTLTCPLLASDTKTVQKVDREELRAAAERYMRSNPGYVPDLRSSNSGWSASGERTAYRCESCGRDRENLIQKGENRQWQTIADASAKDGLE